MGGIKSILVHMTTDDDHMMRLRVAFNLCKRYGAHMTVLSINTPVHMPSGIEGRGASMSYLHQQQDIAAEKSNALEAELAEWCKKEDVTYVWRQMKGDHLKLLSAETYYHDLAIVSQSEPSNLEEMLFAELPDHLPLVSSCPVIVLPHQAKSLDFGKRVLIAWKPCREAARALHAALPFLQTADQVKVLMAGSKSREQTSLDEVYSYLMRHDIKADIEFSKVKNFTIHDLILDTANTMDADMLVVGGFSQRRMMHVVLGSDTRKILSRTQAPVLMAH